MWPQIMYIILISIGLIVSLHPKTDTNAWHYIITASIEVFILYSGGFFNGL